MDIADDSGEILEPLAPIHHGNAIPMSQLPRLAVLAILACAGCATNGPSGPFPELPVGMPTIPAENFVPAVAPTEVGARCVATRGATIPKGHRVLAMMFFPTRGAVPARAIDVEYDAGGAAYEYKDLRGEVDMVQTVQSEHTYSRSTLMGSGSHTKISLDLLNQTGTASNSDKKGKETIVRLSGPNLLTAESLGRPGELIAWIWEQCGRPR